HRASAARLSSETRGVHPCLYIHTQKAQLCVAKSGPCSAHKRNRSDFLYSRRRTQFARTFGRAYPRRSSQRSPRGALSHHPWNFGFHRSSRKAARTFQIRSEETEVRKCRVKGKLEKEKVCLTRNTGTKW